MFEELPSKRLEQQLQVQQEKTFNLVLLDMVAGRVSGEVSVRGTSQHCFQISANTCSKYEPGKPRHKLSGKRTRWGKSHETLLQKNNHIVLLLSLCHKETKGVRRKREESLT